MTAGKKKKGKANAVCFDRKEKEKMVKLNLEEFSSIINFDYLYRYSTINFSLS